MEEVRWSNSPEKSRRRARLIRWLPPLLTFLIRVLSGTLRYRIHMPRATRRLFDSEKAFIVAFWHGRMLLMPHIFKSQYTQARPAWTLISRHWDGEIIARTVSPLGIHSVRGSSTRGGKEAFGELVGKVEADEVVSITPDGPRGPRFHVQPGVVRLARRTGVPIVPVSWSSRPGWRMPSWDRFQIPLPFARVFADFGEPMVVRSNMDADETEMCRRSLEKRMRRLNHETDALARGACERGWLSLGYNLLLYFFSLMALPFFMWKIVRVEKHRAGFSQRLGLYGGANTSSKDEERPLWIHAVSVGEVLATVPFVKKVLKAVPNLPIVVSTITPTGQAVARKKIDGARRIIYFPFDFPFSTRRALRNVCPFLFVHTETEIWPNFLFALGAKGIPSAIVNGRISSRSSRQYGWFRFFFRRVLGSVTVFGMQSRLDAYRIIRIGADPRRVFVTGNMKFDVPLPADSIENRKGIREEMGLPSECLVFVAGSTHEGEEVILADVYMRLKQEDDGLRMLLAPRHPDRCGEVERLYRQRGISLERRTSRRGKGNGVSRADVLLLDTIGELAHAYATGDVVFVGGSLVPVGGHNLLEPILFKKPVLFGPNTENTAEIANELKQSGGGIEVNDRESLFREAKRLLKDPECRESAGRAAYGILEEHRGATERNLAILRPFLEY